MITARMPGTYFGKASLEKVRFGVANPDKDAILAFMKSVVPSGIAEGYVRDFKKGTSVPHLVDAGYDYGELFWREEDIYNFEHNDIELNPEFCERVLELVGDRR